VDSHTHDLWQQVLSIIQTKLSKPSYDTWFKATKATFIDESLLEIIAPTTFAAEWLENKYTNLIKATLYDYLGRNINIKYSIGESKSAEQAVVFPPKQPASPVNVEEAPPNMLNPKYTFDTFVIGTNNRFAHAASLAVAEAPAKAYNPLFLYGGVGLGKTHLMHAIGHYIMEHNPNMRVLYISSEKFTNEFINAIRDSQGESFRTKYRNIDVLLIDDSIYCW